jgi:aromatic ring-opening dioxygenase catalytic subunit (LigB family)
MPLLFVGHGSPMNAIEENRFTAGWKKIAGKLAPDFSHQDKKVFYFHVMFHRNNVYLFGTIKHLRPD